MKFSPLKNQHFGIRFLELFPNHPTSKYKLKGWGKEKTWLLNIPWKHSFSQTIRGCRLRMIHDQDPRINGIFGDPLIVSFPYYSHTTPIRIPKDMGIVWEAYHKGVPLLGVPGITLDRIFAKFLVLRLLGGKGDLKKDHSHHLFCHKSKMLWEKLQVSQPRIEKDHSQHQNANEFQSHHSIPIGSMVMVYLPTFGLLLW